MSNREQGFIKIGKLSETSVLMHWSFPIGCLLVALFFHARKHEVIYMCSAYAGLIILHELGHAIAARIFGLKVFTIELSGIGGICHTGLPKSRLAAMLFASAGLIVQSVLLAAAIIYLHYYGPPKNTAGSSFAFIFTAVNGLLIIMNLVPIKVRHEQYGTDGYLLWKLIAQLVRRHPYTYPDTSATFSPNKSLLRLGGFVPAGFETGIEILNDNTTTMEFIVGALVKHLGYSNEKAIEMMLDIHNKGGLLIPLDNYELAKEVSFAISEDAKQEGYHLVCRPVDTTQEWPDDAKNIPSKMNFKNNQE